MLSAQEQRRIVAEEALRAKLRKKPREALSLWAVVNSSFGIFIFSSVFLSGLTVGFTKWRDAIETDKKKIEAARRIDLEIASRVSQLSELTKRTTFSHTTLFPAQAAAIGESENDPDVGKLDRFFVVFPEFRGRSLVSLLWELKAIAPKEEAAMLDLAFRASKQVPRFLGEDALEMVKPRGEHDSIWKFRDGLADRFDKEVLAAFPQSRWEQ